MRRNLETRQFRESARRVRNQLWDFMQRLDRDGPVYVCLWNRYRRTERRNELRLSMLGGPWAIGGMDVARWVHEHRAWFGQSKVCRGHHDDCVRYWLTAAGRRALRHRTHFDMRPVARGLVGPGYRSRPLEPHLMPTADQIRLRSQTRVVRDQIV